MGEEVRLRVGHDRVQRCQREEVGEHERAAVLQAAAGHHLVRILWGRLQDLLGAEETSLPRTGRRVLGVRPVGLAVEHLLLCRELGGADRRHACERVPAHLDRLVGELHACQRAEEGRRLGAPLKPDESHAILQRRGECAGGDGKRGATGGAQRSGDLERPAPRCSGLVGIDPPVAPPPPVRWSAKLSGHGYAPSHGSRCRPGGGRGRRRARRGRLRSLRARRGVLAAAGARPQAVGAHLQGGPA